MAFRVLRDYARRAHLEFYRSNPSPFYAVTFELDATRVRSAAKDRGGSTYAALGFAFHRALISIDAFRTRLDGADVVLHDTLRLGFTVPAPDRTFTFATLDWNPDGAAFLAAAKDRMARSSLSVDLDQGGAPDFAYYTALPGVPFVSFTHVRHRDPHAGQPMTAFGRITERAGRQIVPVGVQVNHMYVDGADLGDLFGSAAASFADAF